MYPILWDFIAGPSVSEDLGEIAFVSQWDLKLCSAISGAVIFFFLNLVCEGLSSGQLGDLESKALGCTRVSILWLQKCPGIWQEVERFGALSESSQITESGSSQPLST